MAKTLTPIDIHELINDIVAEALGETSTTIDTSDIVSVGEKLLASGYENTLNALSLVLGRLIVAVRPYDAKLRVISEDYAGEYANRLRKISYYMEGALPAGNWNTQLFTNLKDSFTAGENISGGTAQSTKSQWEQHVRIPLELNFGGQSVWQTAVTTYKYQLKVAFRSEGEFSQFVAGILTTVANEIELQKEAFNRSILINYIIGQYHFGHVINLVAVANQMFGLSLGATDYLTTNRKELLTALVTSIKKTSRDMTYMNTKYNWSPTRTDGKVIMRHTPKADQRLILLDDLLIDSEAMVLPEVFNDEYLKPENGERVAFWQYGDESMHGVVSGTGAVPKADGSAQEATSATTIEMVAGVLYDRDAMMSNWQIDEALTTNIEARKAYYNTWYSFSKLGLNDFSEQGVIFVIEDET